MVEAVYGSSFPWYQPAIGSMKMLLANLLLSFDKRMKKAKKGKDWFRPRVGVITIALK